MGWLEAQERYRKGKTPTDQNVEDLVARRVLRGLGLVQKDLPKLERAIFGETDYDEAIWPRTKKMLKYALAVEDYGHYVNNHDFECYEASGKHTDILERMSEVSPQEVTRPVFMTRITGSTTSMTYSVWDRETFGNSPMTPPFTAITKIRGQDGMDCFRDNLVIVQETELFIRQFVTDLFIAAAQRAIDYE